MRSNTRIRAGSPTSQGCAPTIARSSHRSSLVRARADLFPMLDMGHKSEIRDRLRNRCGFPGFRQRSIWATGPFARVCGAGTIRRARRPWAASAVAAAAVAAGQPLRTAPRMANRASPPRCGACSLGSNRSVRPLPLRRGVFEGQSWSPRRIARRLERRLE
jgi:hypothetical protein